MPNAIGVEPQQRFAMCLPLGMHRTDHAHSVRVPGELWKHLADPNPALAVLLESEWRPQHLAKLLSIAAHGLPQKGLSGFEIKPWLGVKDVDLAGSTPHEQEDDPFCAGRVMRCGCHRRGRNGASRLTGQCGERQLTDPAGAAEQHVATVRRP